MATTKATKTEAETKATAASTTEAKATTKKATKATTEAKATTKKATTTKKAATKTTATKTTTKKTSKKAVEPQVSYLLQFSGKEVNTTNIYETVKTVWVEKFQGKLEDLKTIEIYLKPEEHKAYFVVNGESNGDYFVEL